MKELKIMFNSFKEAIPLYKKVKFKGKKLIPLSIMILLFVLYIILGNKFTEFLIEILSKQFKPDIFTDKIIRLLSKIFTIVIYFYTYKYIVLGLFSPFLSNYSEKVETFYQGKSFKFSFYQNLKFFFRGVGISSTNFIIELLFVGFFFFLGILLPFKPIFYILSILVQCFFIGYSFSDYYYERKEYGVRKSLKEALNNVVAVTLIGGVFILIFAIPIIGILYGPIYCTGVTTLYLLKKEKIN